MRVGFDVCAMIYVKFCKQNNLFVSAFLTARNKMKQVICKCNYPSQSLSYQQYYVIFG